MISVYTQSSLPVNMGLYSLIPCFPVVLGPHFFGIWFGTVTLHVPYYVTTNFSDNLNRYFLYFSAFSIVLYVFYFWYNLYNLNINAFESWAIKRQLVYQFICHFYLSLLLSNVLYLVIKISHCSLFPDCFYQVSLLVRVLY